MVSRPSLLCLFKNDIYIGGVRGCASLFVQDKVCDEMDYTPQNDSSHDEELDEEAEDKARKRQAEAEKEKVSALGCVR